MSVGQTMHYPVKHYSNSDVGAPQLESVDGNIKTILKACLVTGFGGKASAGWTALFEDNYRIIFRRPKVIGDPPDIKIENGIINGVASHRIVSQDNPTGLDDTTELSSVNLLSKDPKNQTEWQLIASDFGFILFHRSGARGENTAKSYIQYCGELQRFSDSQPPLHYFNACKYLEKTGDSPGYVSNFLAGSMLFKDMRTGVSGFNKNFFSLNVPETHFGGDYLAQKIIIQQAGMLPFYVSISSNQNDGVTKEVSIDSRPMLRFVDNGYSASAELVAYRAYYIPLDYWEL